MSRARVLLADDNASVAAQIRELLEEAFDVVGVVASGEALEAACDALAPDVVVADVVMPGEGGLAAARRIHARLPDTRVVFLSLLATSPVVRLGLAAGGQGYVVKADAGDELLSAVVAALDGRRYLSATARRAMGDA